MKRICVFCGSSPGKKKEFTETAINLGKALAKSNISLVYGGASIGIMGQLAKAALENGGEVIGVITKELADMEIAFTEITHLHVVDSMHERKALMAELSDGFIALPGGFGTLEEFFEVLTWTQLGIHSKPCGLLNVSNYFDHLMDFIKTMEANQFIDAIHKEMILTADIPEDLIKSFLSYNLLHQSKVEWVRKMNNL